LGSARRSIDGDQSQLEIVQYKQRGRDPRRMMAFDQQLLRDVEDFIAKPLA
jgi:hypothetical protein